MSYTLFVGNDNLIYIKSLKDILNNTYINTGSLSFTMKDEDGVPLSIDGVTWPVSMMHISGQDGCWFGEVPADWPLTAESRYRIAITIVADGKTAMVELPAVAKTRTALE